jgi:hypothetical protein
MTAVTNRLYRSASPKDFDPASLISGVAHIKSSIFVLSAERLGI